MNEELQHRLTKYLNYLESAASTGADAVSAATPVVCQEILVWNAVFYLQFSVPTLMVALFFQKIKSDYVKSLKAREGDGYVYSSCDSDMRVYKGFSVLGWAIFLSVFAVSLASASRSYLTPHLVIIDAVKSVIQN